MSVTSAARSQLITSDAVPGALLHRLVQALQKKAPWRMFRRLQGDDICTDFKVGAGGRIVNESGGEFLRQLFSIHYCL